MATRPPLSNGILRDEHAGKQVQRFVLLPPEGLWPTEQERLPFTYELFASLAGSAEKQAPIGILRPTDLWTDVDEYSDRGLVLALAVIPPPKAEINRGAYQGLGPTLVEMDSDALIALRRVPLWVRVVPEQPISLMTSLPTQLPTRAPTGTIRVTIEVNDVRGHPVKDAEVQAFTDVRLALGDTGVTDVAGAAVLQLAAQGGTIERLYVRADRARYWGRYQTGVAIGSSSHHLVVLNDVDLSSKDCLRQRYSPYASDGADVRIGLLDTGVDEGHPCLTLAGGTNTVPNEPDADYGDNGTNGHGTHMAGIIAANPSNAQHPMGLAPSASLFSYRVCRQGETTVDGTFAVLAAAIQAVSHDGCHLLNMSFGGLDPDPVWADMDKHIWENGALAFAAAGNTNRGTVTLPAALSHVAAVGAVGRLHTYPPGSLEEADEMGRYGDDPDDYTAAFSPEDLGVQLAAPGVGLISTLPGGGYGPWSGTSQACAAAVGRAAALLGGSGVLSLEPDRSRSGLLWGTLFGQLNPLGMGLKLEGGGVLQ